jgi:hypothetical protein
MKPKSAIALLALAVLLVLGIRWVMPPSRGQWSLATVKTYADAEVKIERMRKRQPAPDWTAIRAEYEKTLPVLRLVDEQEDSDYEQRIDRALARCAAGEDAKVNQQVLAKGLQWITVKAIEARLTALEHADKRQLAATISEIAAFAEGIRPTFVRRDQSRFNGRKTLESLLDKNLSDLKQAAAAGDSGVHIAARSLENTILRVYALSILFEIEQIEKHRDVDRDACRVKLKEADIFYEIIAEKVRQRNPKADRTIRNMLASDFSNMNSDLLKELLERSLPGIEL